MEKKEACRPQIRASPWKAMESKRLVLIETMYQRGMKEGEIFTENKGEGSLTSQ